MTRWRSPERVPNKSLVTSFLLRAYAKKMVYTSFSSVEPRTIRRETPVKKKTKKSPKNQQKGTKLAIHRETLRALDEEKLVLAAGGATRCPTACSLC